MVCHAHAHTRRAQAEWFAEGLLERLTGSCLEGGGDGGGGGGSAAADAAAATAAATADTAAAAAAAGGAAAAGADGVDAEVQQLLSSAVLFIVPNMCPDGSVR
jgi:hypothetical protein